MKKFQFLIALLVSVITPLSAQETNDDYNAACRWALAEQPDSAFRCLHRWTDLRGAQYAQYFFTPLVTDPDLRTLHGDPRWREVVERIRTLKREAEAQQPVCYPRIEDTIHAADTPEVLRYDLRLGLDVAARTASVSGTLEIDFKGRDSIDLILWGCSEIHSIRCGASPVRFRFDTLGPSPIQYIPDGRLLRLANPQPQGGPTRIAFDYRCDMNRVEGWAQAFRDDWIELGFYTAWYPVNIDSQRARSETDIAIDDRYRVDGSGIVTRSNGLWHISQPWASFDNVVLVSPALKSRRLAKEGLTFEVVYTDFPDTDADSVLHKCVQMLAFYRKLYKNPEGSDRYLKFSVSTSNGGGGYSRPNFISFNAIRYDESLANGIAHEMAHFWWNKAPTTDWNDWLNESFTEFSMLWYIRKAQGETIYNDHLEAYRENTYRSSPIWEIDRDSPEAYTALYEKGALILCDLEQELGEEQFFRYLRGGIKKQIRTTAEFLGHTERTLGKVIRERLEQRLKD